MWKYWIWTLVASSSLATARAEQPVAVIVVAEGKVNVINAQNRTQIAHSLDWLPAGVIVETAPGARAILAFAGGQRCELGPSAKISITPDGPVNPSGPLRHLEKLPPMPKLPPINVVAGASAMAGLRPRPADSVRLLFPQTRLSTLPEHTILHFTSHDSTARYQVEIADQSGNIVYRSEAVAGDVKVPAGELKSGRVYRWRVTAAGEVFGEANFTTVSDETIARRAALQAAIGNNDADSMLLLASLDAQLGLFEEARDELRQAIAHAHDPEDARKLLAIIDASMQ